MQMVVSDILGAGSDVDVLCRVRANIVLTAHNIVAALAAAIGKLPRTQPERIPFSEREPEFDSPELGIVLVFTEGGFDLLRYGPIFLIGHPKSALIASISLGEPLSLILCRGNSLAALIARQTLSLKDLSNALAGYLIFVADLLKRKAIAIHAGHELGAFFVRAVFAPERTAFCVRARHA